MRAEWLIVADAAEVVSGKLYLLGGGWDRLTVNTGFPLQRPVAIAVAFEVPWDETNIRYPMEMVVEDEDGHRLANVSGQIEAGRPAGMPAGQPQRIQLAINAPLSFQHPGTYVISARIEGQEVGRTTFHVTEGPAMPQP